jgi:site-specific DNA-methyltransferase (adenine-specific)
VRHNGNGSPIVWPQYVGERGVLFRADCLDLLANIRQGTVDLVFADPPFNLGKRYEDPEISDQLHQEAYRGWCRSWMLEAIRVLKPGGALFVYHWPKWLMDFGSWLNGVADVEFRSWIALKMKSGFPIPKRLHPAHYGLLYFTKGGAKPKFNVVRVKSPTCRKCGQLHRDYGGYRDKYRKYEDEEGIPWIQISDFWEDTRPAIHDKAREQQINELPVHIPERAILMATNPGDIVLDCFAGAGSTIHAAQRTGRYWIAGDIGESQAALRRIATFWGTKERSSIPKKIGNCFSKRFRDAIPFLQPTTKRPIMCVNALPDVAQAAYSYAARSRVWVPQSEVVDSKSKPRSRVLAGGRLGLSPKFSPPNAVPPTAKTKTNKHPSRLQSAS